MPYDDYGSDVLHMIPISFMFIECKQDSEESILEKIRAIS
jgi:hypothetical protein